MRIMLRLAALSALLLTAACQPYVEQPLQATPPTTPPALPTGTVVVQPQP